MFLINVFSEEAKQHFRLGMVAVSAIALVACGGGDDASESTEPAPTETPSEANPTPETENDGIPGAVSRTSIGDVFVFGPNNRTLYTFADDESGISNCTEGCAQAWPPILADAEQSTGPFTTVQRADSSLQWAFKGWPLYYYQGDAAEGEVNGEGLSDAWFVARPDPFATGETTLGTVLVGQGTVNSGSSDLTQRPDLDGRTLYVFANDTANSSNCQDTCAVNWPPLYADKGAVTDGDYAVIARNDGTSQWAYKSQPLYFYAGDSATGDTTGDGVGGVWSVARP